MFKLMYNNAQATEIINYNAYPLSPGFVYKQTRIHTYLHTILSLWVWIHILVSYLVACIVASFYSTIYGGIHSAVAHPPAVIFLNRSCILVWVCNYVTLIIMNMLIILI